MRRGKGTRTFARVFKKRERFRRMKKKKEVETWIPMTRRWKFIRNARSRTYNFYIYTVVIRKKKNVKYLSTALSDETFSRLKKDDPDGILKYRDLSSWDIYIYICSNSKISTLFRQTSRQLSRLHRTSIASAVFSHIFPHFANTGKQISPSLPSPGRWRLDASNRK